MYTLTRVVAAPAAAALSGRRSPVLSSPARASPRSGYRVVQIFIGERRAGPRGAGLSVVWCAVSSERCAMSVRRGAVDRPPAAE